MDAALRRTRVGDGESGRAFAQKAAKRDTYGSRTAPAELRSLLQDPRGKPRDANGSNFSMSKIAAQARAIPESFVLRAAKRDSGPGG